MKQCYSIFNLFKAVCFGIKPLVLLIKNERNSYERKKKNYGYLIYKVSNLKVQTKK